MTQETAPEPLQTAESPQKESELKFCAKCAHLLGVRHYTETVGQWKCAAPQNIDKEGIDLITGNQFRTFKYEIGYLRYGPWDIQQPTCGKEGKWYEEYIPPDHTVPTIKGIEATEIVFNEDAQQASREAAQKRLQELKNKKSNSRGPNLSTIKADEL